MGFWNIIATELRPGDEIRVTVMGGEEYLEVKDVETIPDGQVRALLSWGFHIPRADFYDTLSPGEKLTVRR